MDSAKITYAMTLAAVVLAAIIRWMLNPILGVQLPYPPFFIAVAFAAWLGGWRPAMLATWLGFLIVINFFMPPLSSVLNMNGPYITGLVMYLTVCFAFAGFGEVMRTSQARLAEQSERLRTTLASIGDAVITTDSEGRVTYLNSVAENLTAWTNADALGQPLESVFQIVNETTRRSVENPALRALRENVIVGLANHTVLIARDGTERSIDDSAAPIHAGDGQVVGCVLIFRDIGEQRKLQRQASLLASIIHSSNDPIISKTLDGVIQSWNEAAERVFGYTAAEAISRPMTLVIPADRYGEEEQILARLRSGQRIEHFDTVRVRADGTLIHVSLTISPIRDASGEIIGASKIVRDITESKQAAEMLRDSEERRRLALDTAELGTWNIDPETNLLTSDDRFRMIFLGSGNPISYEQAFAAIHPDDRERIRAAVGAAIRPDNPSPYAQEYRVIHSDGSIHWIFGKGRANFESGRLTSFDGTVADITDRKRSEELIRESEHRLRFILDSMPQKVFTATATGEVDYINPIWMEFTGLTFEQIGDWGWTSFVHPDDVEENVRLWKKAVATGNPFEFEQRFRNADGAYRWHVSRATALKGASGLVQLWVGASTDIHEQRLTADELREVAAKLSEADHRKDEFLATLAHELRNPLAPIRNGLQVMRLAKNDPRIIEQSRAMMERQLDQMVRLVDDLMDVSRISRGKLELKRQRVELATVINSAIETSRPLIDQMGHQLTVSLPDEPIILNADLIRLAQVFLNLLNNSAKYSERGGHIHLAAACENHDVVVSVKDTGIGIAADQLPRVFEMFSQVDRSLEKSQGGLGIGLTLVRSLVEMHSGKVMAYSDGPGQGSEFVVTLPLVAEPSTSDGSKAGGQESSPKSSLRILIVDDNRDSADSLALMLQFMGNEILTAYDGEEAVASASSFRPDVILLDIGLPKLNGYEACRRIRQQSWGQGIVIIAQTGWGQEEDRQRTQDAGFDRHMVKPVDPALLVSMLADLSDVAKSRNDVKSGS